MYSRSNLVQIDGKECIGVPFPRLTRKQEEAAEKNFALHATKEMRAEVHPKEKNAVLVTTNGRTGKDSYTLKMSEGFTHSFFGRAMLWYDDYLVISAPRADISIEGEERWRSDIGVVSVWLDGQLVANFTCSAKYKRPVMFGADIWLEDDKLMTWWRYVDQDHAGNQVACYAIGEIPIKETLNACTPKEPSDPESAPFAFSPLRPFG